MHRSRLLTLIYCLTGAGAAWLAWATQTLLGETTFLAGVDPGYSITRTSLGDGWLTLACCCTIMAITVAGRRLQPMNRKKIVWIKMVSFISLVISGYHLVIILSLPKATVADDLQMKVAPGVGLYLTVLVSLLLVIQPAGRRATVNIRKREV